MNIININIKKHSKLNSNENIKILYYYRYFSLFLTTLFYLVKDTNGSLLNKLIVATCIIISGVILNYLYLMNISSINVIKLLVLLEIISNTAILIPTGGINSPYIWYFLNTFLISSYLLNKYYCLFNLCVYTIISTIISNYTIDKQSRNIVGILLNNSNLLLSIILVTVAMYEVVILSKRLKTDSLVLEKSNKKIKETMEEMISLYETVHLLSSENDRDKLISSIIEYSLRITKSKEAYFLIKNEELKWKVQVSSMEEEEIKERIAEEINKNKDENLSIAYGDKTYISLRIKSMHKDYGILCILKNDYLSGEQLRFLSEISSILIEKIQLDSINKSFIINEEQNRIADEIHDSVTQRLLSISCATYSLKEKINNITNKEANSNLVEINNSINIAMKELRKTIYGLSLKKYGKDVFYENLNSYLDDLKKINNINIVFHIQGEVSSLKFEIKKALYRIICESAGNAVNHGKCKNIKINLTINDEYTELNVNDDGLGFNVNAIEEREGGIGLRNMRYLVKSLNGDITITSKANEGTNINILFLDYNILKEAR